MDKYVEGYTYINLRNGWILSNNGMYRLADAANRDEVAHLLGEWAEQHAAMMWVNRTDQPTPARADTPLNTVDLTGELLVLRSSSYRTGSYAVLIVKLDDIGFWLEKKSSAIARGIGKSLLVLAPWLMKSLSVVGTLAMFLVGGGIVVHGIAPLHHAIEHFASAQGAVVAAILPTLLNLVLGFIIGAIVVAAVKAVEKMRGASH